MGGGGGGLEVMMYAVNIKFTNYNVKMFVCVCVSFSSHAMTMEDA